MWNHQENPTHISELIKGFVYYTILPICTGQSETNSTIEDNRHQSKSRADLIETNW